MQKMREDLREVARRLCDAGDLRLRYVDGLHVFNHDEIAAYTTDQCHPNGDGMFVQAANFSSAVMANWISPMTSAKL
eukprot:SAG31_NODE_1692_length_7512_cov_4.735465_5_plen_77_part_00